MIRRRYLIALVLMALLAGCGGTWSDAEFFPDDQPFPANSSALEPPSGPEVVTPIQDGNWSQPVNGTPPHGELPIGEIEPANDTSNVTVNLTVDAQNGTIRVTNVTTPGGSP